jgi:putative transposase
MARPYSMDLRERAVARVQAGESVRLIARALSLSPSSVVKWSQRFRATGSAAAGKMGGHRPRLLAGERAEFLRQRIAQREFTLRGLVAELAGRGLKVDYRTVWTFVRGEGLSFKKNRSAKRARPAGHRPQAGALEGLSRPDRSEAARLHR